MFNAIVSLCEKHGFLRKVVLTSQKIEQLKLGPTGWLLLQNLRNEWFNNIVVNKDLSIFLTENNDFRETFEFAKNMCLERLPFGVAEIVPAGPNDLIGYLSERMKNKDDMDFEKLFGNEDRSSLKCSIFTCGSDSVQMFHQWQRQRRIWWRKFSPNPGRYNLTDIKTDETTNIQSVQIVANYPWKSQTVETIVLNPKPKGLSDLDKFKHGKKLIQCQSIACSIDLTTMFINTICDAFDQPEYKDTKRTLLRFHRKLAPYSISFAISSGVAATISELNDLALYLAKQLRSHHVSTLFLPSSSKLSLEAQWRQYDEIGIPFNVLLNEKTLKDGLALLRNRDTTLKEQVHVSELVGYVEQLFKNY